MMNLNGFAGMTLAFAMLAAFSVVDAGEDQDRSLTLMTYSIGIQGMTCETCSAHAQKELAAVPGVVKSSVDWKTGRAWVTVQLPRQEDVRTANPRQISTKLATAVERSGYRPTVNYLLIIKGMTCEACSQHIQDAIVKVPGVSAASVNYKGGYAVVVPKDKARYLAQNLVAAVKKVGYTATVHTRP
ncbi:MAG: hypothetical protein CME32_31710 [Gimesia sp.]|nr:cation transporter [Gimesia chilikensis]MBN73847.1 hypothetical protein [Gimesia sp.]